MNWKFKAFYVLLVLLWHQSSNAQSTHILFETDFGNIKVMLYDFTPKHKALILEQIHKKTYQNAYFNRIVDGFVVQGGELDETILEREKRTGKFEGRLEPEFDEKAYHKIGALGAGRDDNSAKASYFNQIYFVVGKAVNEAYFDTLANKYNKHFKPKQKELYLKNGGQPRLDGDYTIFGEVMEGWDVLQKIAKEKTNIKTQKPKKKVRFSVSIIKD